MADVHLDDELRVDQTTPQGSQDNAVEHGHEERDTNVGGIMKWLIGTGVLALVVLALVVGIFRTLDSFNLLSDPQAKPAPMVRRNQVKTATYPHIEGLIVDGQRAGMTEHLMKVRERESGILSKWQLGESDVNTWSVPLSEAATRDVPAPPVGGNAAGVDRMFNQGQLSDASGGLKHNVGR